MIVIATGKEDLDENLKEHLEDSEIVESTDGKEEPCNSKLNISADKDIENIPFDYYENLYKYKTAPEFENSMHPFDKGLYEDEEHKETEEPKEIEEAEEIKKVVTEKENNKTEVVKSSDTNNLTNNTVAIPVVQAVKKENIFVFTLNYIYKLLSLFVNLITALLENLQWLVWSIIVTAAAYYAFKNGGIDSFDTLVKIIKAYFKLG